MQKKRVHIDEPLTTMLFYGYFQYTPHSPILCTSFPNIIMHLSHHKYFQFAKFRNFAR